MQQAAGPAARPLDEVLDRMTALQYLVEVGIEHRGIQPIALETAPQEEGAAAPQDRPDDGNVEIDTGRDMRRVDSLLEQRVAEQQVIEMAAMAGYVDHFLGARDLVQPIDVTEFHAVVDTRPEPAQKSLDQTNRCVGDVGRDLERIVARLLARSCQRFRIVAGFVPDCLAYAGCPQYLVDERPAVGQVRANRCGTPLAKMDPKDS